jgi:hypothetical protein
MKSLLLALLISASLCAPALARKKVAASHLSDFGEVIRTYGYVCNSCTEGYFNGRGNRGLDFEIICDDYLFVYRVIARPDGGFTVTPK